MKNTWKIQGMALALLLSTGVAQGQEHLLAQAGLTAEQGTYMVQLWGDQLEGGYAYNLMLLVKDEDEKIVTAYAPSIKGGYNPLLQAVNVLPASSKDKPVNAASKQEQDEKQQLLLAVGQGDWQAPTEFRVLDFARPAKVRELFSGADSMGIVTKAYIKEEKLHVALADGSQNKASLPDGLLQDARGRLEYGGPHPLYRQYGNPHNPP